jgi:energy-coupling factor transporter ATP-binding protein EcfA2
MHIREIHIENIRGFDDVHLDLDRGGGKYAGWTVLAGRNGTGKSTLLQAIALTVAGDRWAYSLHKSFAGWVRNGSRSASSRMLLSAGPMDGFGPPANEYAEPGLYAVELRWRIENGGPEPRLIPDGTEVTTMLGPWAPNPEGWFIAGYGPFRRIGNREDRERTGGHVLAGLATLFDEDATLGEAIQWLKHDVYGARLDRQERARKLRGKDDDAAAVLEEEADSLERLHNIVLSLLNDGLLPPGVEVVDFDLEGLWVQQAGVSLPLRQLSDGYRAAAALVFDILRQMHARYKALEVDLAREPLVVPYEGVVLIDEVDAHLHPEWQKRIGFWLKEHFPNVQFIVTTHSPFICQAADPRGLIRLPVPGSGDKADHVSEEDFRTIVNGSADDAVLTALFGLEHAHSDQAEEKKKRAAALEAKVIRGTATVAEQSELGALQSVLPDSGAAMVERLLRKHEALR